MGVRVPWLRVSVSCSVHEALQERVSDCVCRLLPVPVEEWEALGSRVSVTDVVAVPVVLGVAVCVHTADPVGVPLKVSVASWLPDPVRVTLLAVQDGEGDPDRDGEGLDSGERDEDAERETVGTGVGVGVAVQERDAR